MIKYPISRLHAKTLRLLTPNIIFAHTKTCPVAQQLKSCPGSGSDGTTGVKLPDFKRAERSAPCRLAFIPDNWFVFFYSKTGVSGPYIFGIVLSNYLLSKEIYVLEHEYYGGLSIALILCLATQKFGASFAAAIDEQVDEVQAMYDKERQNEVHACENFVKECKEVQWRAEGQKVLMDAKKECVAMQLELEYRRRIKEVHDTVKGKMEYHIKKDNIERRLLQICMVDWILDNVYKSITPEFRKQSLERAVQDFANAGPVKGRIS